MRARSSLIVDDAMAMATTTTLAAAASAICSLRSGKVAVLFDFVATSSAFSLDLKGFVDFRASRSRCVVRARISFVRSLDADADALATYSPCVCVRVEKE